MYINLFIKLIQLHDYYCLPPAYINCSMGKSSRVKPSNMKSIYIDLLFTLALWEIVKLGLKSGGRMTKTSFTESNHSFTSS